MGGFGWVWAVDEEGTKERKDEVVWEHMQRHRPAWASLFATMENEGRIYGERSSGGSPICTRHPASAKVLIAHFTGDSLQSVGSS